MVDESDTLFEFPCTFSIKAMGHAGDDLCDLVEQLVSPHLKGEPLTTKKQPSRMGKYESITVSFTATSKLQLDEIYLSLTANDRMLYVL